MHATDNCYRCGEEYTDDLPPAVCTDGYSDFLSPLCRDCRVMSPLVDGKYKFLPEEGHRRMVELAKIMGLIPETATPKTTVVTRAGDGFGVGVWHYPGGIPTEAPPQWKSGQVPR